MTGRGRDDVAVAMVRVHRHKSIDNLPAIRRKREGGIITSRACALYSCAVLQLSYLHREHPPAVLLACIAPSCCSSLEDSVSLYPSFNAAVVSNPHHCTLQPTLLFNPSYCIIPCKHRRTNQQTHMDEHKNYPSPRHSRFYNHHFPMSFLQLPPDTN